MKTIIRNFLSLLRRYRLAATLNVLGLSVAFAAFLVIMIQVDYDRTFDRCHPDAGRIFRLEAGNLFGGDWWALASRPWADAITGSSAHILAGALMRPSRENTFFSVEAGDERRYYQEPFTQVTPSFADVFTFDMAEGSHRALDDPEKALIPLSLARKLFGDAPATGRTLTGRDGGEVYTVGGVYRDFPRNSSVGNSVYTVLDTKPYADLWNDWHFQCFIRVDEAENAAGLFDNLRRTFQPPASLGNDFRWEDDGLKFRFTNLADLHFIAGVAHDQTPKSDARTLFILICIAGIIVAMAAINYTNFSTALVPKRIRSINIQKVLGGRVRVIRMALLAEAVVICLLAFVLSVVVVHVVAGTPLASLVEADLSLRLHPGWVAMAAGLAVGTGLVAGLYPSWRVTSFPAALALKGNFGLSPRGRKMRSILTGIQFFASFALIISAAFIYLQNVYMQRAPLGYDRDELIVTDLTPALAGRSATLAGRMRTFAGVDDVTFAAVLLSSADSYGSWGRDFRGKEISFNILPVDESFLRVMGIGLTGGRDFREGDRQAPGGAFIFNEKARKAFDLTLDEAVGGVEVVGFMPDVKFASFRTEVSPMAFYLSSAEWTRPRYAYIKVGAGAGLREAISHVRQTLREFDADYPFDVRFFDQVLQRTYEQEQRLGSLIALFRLVAIFISIMGVFGLVIFDSEYRRREIGIRKVFGSTTGEILLTFGKPYVLILCACFALSSPVAWYAVSRWLEGFAYRTPMYGWVYLAAFMVVAVLTAGVVTFQNRRAASMNPVESIKAE